MTAADRVAGRLVLEIARREIRARVRTKGFVWGTLGMLVAVLGYAALMTMFAGDDPRLVGLAPQNAALAQPLQHAAQASGEQLEVRPVRDRRAAAAQLREGELDVWVTGSPDALQVVVDQRLPDALQAVLHDVAAQRVVDGQLAAAGLDPAQVARQAMAATVQVSTLEPVDPRFAERLALGLAGAFLLYLALIIYGSYVAQGVVEEKSSRVVEVLLATVRPWQLMAGKLIGIGGFGLLQLGLLTVAAAVAASATGLLTVPAAGPVLIMLGWFLLGYFLFAGVLAAAGALVSRQEEVQSVISPVMTALVVPFVLSVYLLVDDPDSRLVGVLSLIPPLSPILMPARLMLGGVPAWQVALAVGLVLAAIVAVTALAARVYAGAVLRTGARVRLGEALAGPAVP